MTETHYIVGNCYFFLLSSALIFDRKLQYMYEQFKKHSGATKYQPIINT